MLLGDNDEDGGGRGGNDDGNRDDDYNEVDDVPPCYVIKKILLQTKLFVS